MKIYLQCPKPFEYMKCAGSLPKQEIKTLDQFIKDHCELTLKHNKNNIALTARQLGIHRNRLYRILNCKPENYSRAGKRGE